MTCKDRVVADNYCLHYIGDGCCSLQDRFTCEDYYDFNLSYSAMKSFAQCHRRYYWEYDQRLELIEKPIVLLKGEIVHKVLAYIHTGEDIKEYAAIDAIVDTLTPETEEPIADFTAIKGLLYAYLDNPSLSSLRGNPEFEFMTKVRGCPSLHGFIDLMQYENHIAYEFKTTARPEIYHDRLTTDGQIGVYFMGVPELERMTLRIIRLPELRLGKNENPAGYFDRVRADVAKRPKHYFQDLSYWRSEFNFKEITERARRIGRDIKLYRKEGFEGHYQNTMACFWPSQCPYLQLCKNGLTPDRVPENLYKRRIKK